MSGSDGAPSLSAVGRAERERLEDGRERWVFPGGSASVVARLVALGARGVGRFSADPTCDHAALRSPLEPTLRARWGPQPWSFEETLRVLRPLAAALAHCERRSLFPGPLTPRTVWVDGDEAGLVAQPLVASLAGAPAPLAPPVGRWTPPEPAQGAPWSHASNRFAFGLLMYRSLAGVHPFEGGRRLGLADGAQRGAPPLPDAVALSLPPGVQALCLRLLSPVADTRPSFAEVCEALEGRFAPTPEAAAVAQAHAEPPALQAPKRRARGWSVVPVVLGLGAAAFLGSRSPQASRPSVPVGPALPMASDATRADDCASCHPEHAAQWHGSVMAHSVKSPLFGALEMLIQEQVGKSDDCPGGAGALREAGPGACFEPTTGVRLTGTGGALWCVNCHAPGENLAPAMPAWDGTSASSATRRPVVDLLPPRTLEGIGCAFCHQVDGPARPGNAARGDYEGNPDWISPVSGRRFLARPEDREGRPGIGNSGYHVMPGAFADGPPIVAGGHARPRTSATQYLRSSEFCGGCHDVRLFGTDARAAQATGEHFKRLRNAYSEWVDWAATQRAAGRQAASCQDCHMSLYPGICVDADEAAPLESRSGTRYTALERACPPGTRFSAVQPGTRPTGRAAAGSEQATAISSHAFAGVDVPLSPLFPAGLIDDPGLDAHGSPRGIEQRRDLLLGSTFRFTLGEPSRARGRVEIPLTLENVGAGHKVPAGFSQEREIWVHLTVTDAQGRVLYEVGRIDSPAQNLRDKRFVRVNVDDRLVDRQGQPLGVFGADVVDGPDVPQWERVGRDAFIGRGLVNLQNGFQRCVTCIGRIDAQGRCQPGPGQGRHRADRYADGAYDIDTGACLSNLEGEERFLEVYFPVGALDATRGLTKGPDAIIDERSAVAGEPQRYTYALSLPAGPLKVRARLMFRAFPPFLIEAFADYEAQQAARGLRPSGPLVTRDMLDRLEAVELAVAEVTVP
ncbi:MAG: hypothetical protein ACE37F_12935 [Nannocystaceae bacterium]|nr:hypothetical protein [bacterium]